MNNPSAALLKPRHEILLSLIPHVVIILLLMNVPVTRLAAQEVKTFVPNWVKDVTFYQIFPERFANGDSTNDPPNTEPWGGVPKTNNYFGGDLKGVADHIEYLSRLGVTAVYFNPIFESPSNHKYHTSDYMKIDQHFGNDSVFKQVIDECHKRGMRVVIDGVFNHTGVHFWAFEDIVKNEEKSKYLKWYNVHSFPVASPEKPNYEAWWGLGDLPKLMTDNPEVRKYLFEVTTKWTKMGVDGWRLDVPNEIPHDFWVQWRKLVKKLNPECYIVGEIWDDATPWLQGDQFDAVMNYRFRGACVGFIALENLTTTQFDSVLAVQRSQYPDEVNFSLQNLLGSHDTERFLTLCNGDDDKLKLATLFQMTYPGAPMMYYGDEIGMEGGKDPDCRRTMIWDSTKWNTGILEWCRKLVNIRNENPVLREGSFTTVLANNDLKLYGFLRVYGNTKALVVLNNKPTSAEVSSDLIPMLSETWYDVLHEASIEKGAKALIVPERSGIILISQKRR
jgi:cyclomaltodextrinase